MNAPANQDKATAESKTESVNLTETDALVTLAGRAIALASRLNRRIIIGIVGGPGSGKSTLAGQFIQILDDAVANSTALLPMDGFHRPHAELVAEGLEQEKGAPHTFDADGFLVLLTKLKAATAPLKVPTYSREIEDVVPDAITIAPNVPIIIAEGNYLLLENSPWDKVRDLLDFSVFLNVPRDRVRARLLKRHAEHGKFSEQRNISHVDNVDLANYDLVAASKDRADLIINLISEH